MLSATLRSSASLLASILCIMLTAFAQGAPRLSAEGLEGGNLQDWKLRDNGVIEFTARRDGSSRTWRWFYFRVIEPGTGTLTFEIPDARSARASSGWRFGRPFVSKDGGETWQRTAETEYSGGRYRFTVETDGRDLLLALAPPYHYQRNLDWIAAHREDPRVVQAEKLGESLEGRPIHHLVIRQPGDSPLPIAWVIARQHPAETASSWKMEGLLNWLLSEDPEAAALLERVEFHIVPFMNPDGVVHGYYRFNTAGLDLNREWQNDDNTASPTVGAVKELMQRQHTSGREFLCFVDLHAISSKQKNFMYFTEDLLLRDEYTEEMTLFMRTFAELNPQFTAMKSEGTYPGEEGIAKDWVHSEFFAPTYTFESSYQNIDYSAEPGSYMLVDDYKSLGRDLGRTIRRIYVPTTD